MLQFENYEHANKVFNNILNVVGSNVIHLTESRVKDTVCRYDVITTNIPSVCGVKINSFYSTNSDNILFLNINENGYESETTKITDFSLGFLANYYSIVVEYVNDRKMEALGFDRYQTKP